MKKVTGHLTAGMFANYDETVKQFDQMIKFFYL